MRYLTFFMLLATIFIIGCGRDNSNNTILETDTSDNTILNEDVDLGFVDTTWEIVSINDQPFKSLFSPDPASEYPTTLDVTSNSWVFGASGNLTGELAFTISEEYPGDPSTSNTQLVTYTVTGQYTAGSTTLTIKAQDVEFDVEVTLAPREVWEQRIEGITLERLQTDLAADSKDELTQDEPVLPFTAGIDYTHQTEQNTLTLSVPGEEILLKKVETPQTPQ